VEAAGELADAAQLAAEADLAHERQVGGDG
jgi:hypothetical protein